MTLKERIGQENIGGTLPVYVAREEDAIIGPGKKGELACFYCGFSKNGGHDYACRYIWWAKSLCEHTHKNVVYIDVPVGGIKPSESFF